jgi:NhaP-type Na+/H+ or K+/H+ antiporter
MRTLKYAMTYIITLIKDYLSFKILISSGINFILACLAIKIIIFAANYNIKISKLSWYQIEIVSLYYQVTPFALKITGCFLYQNTLHLQIKLILEARY